MSDDMYEITKSYIKQATANRILGSLTLAELKEKLAKLQQKYTLIITTSQPRAIYTHGICQVERDIEICRAELSIRETR